MRFRVEFRSRWRTWLTLAMLAGVAGGLVIAGIAGARRTDSALARHLDDYRFPDATVGLSNNSNSLRAVARIRGLPLVQASALDCQAISVALWDNLRRWLPFAFIRKMPPAESALNAIDLPLGDQIGAYHSPTQQREW